MDIPVLVITFRNAFALERRVRELRDGGFERVFVYVDGASQDPTIAKDCLSVQTFANKLLIDGRIANLFIGNTNRGQGKAIPQAVDWFFEFNSFGIILEDDCKISESVGKYLLTVRKLVSTEISEQVLCLSNILPNRFQTSKKNSPVVFPLRFFSSWGWACEKSLWVKFRRYDSNTYHLPKLIHSIPELGVTQKILLSRQWGKQYSKIKSGEQNTWALLFTLFLIDQEIPVFFPSTNLIHHMADKNAVNIKGVPGWYEPIVRQSLSTDLNYFDKIELRGSLSKKEHRYWAKNVFGASIWRYFQGFYVSVRNQLS